MTPHRLWNRPSSLSLGILTAAGLGTVLLGGCHGDPTSPLGSGATGTHESGILGAQPSAGADAGQPGGPGLAETRAPGPAKASAKAPQGDRSATVPVELAGSADGLSLSPSRGAFGEVQLGKPKRIRFTIGNRSSSDIAIGQITQAAGPFVLGSDPCSRQTLRARTSCSLYIVYQPSVAGGGAPDHAAFYLPYRYRGTRRLSIDLTGTAVDPGGSPRLVLTPRSHDFGPVDVGDLDAFTFEARNAGGGTLRIDPISDHGGPFRLGVAECSGRSLGRGETCRIEVVYEPVAAGGGTDRDVFLVSTNDAANPVAQILVSGIAAAPFPTISADVSPLYPTSGDPGGAAVNLSNVGIPGSSLVVSSVATNKAGITVGSDSCSGNALAQGDSCRIIVICAPGTAGTTGTLVVQSNDATQPSMSLLVHCI